GNLERVIHNYSLDDVAAVAQGLGLATERLPSQNGGDPYMVIKLQQGAIFATPHCLQKDPARCVGLEFQAVYSQQNVPLNIINQYNDDQDFAQTYIHQGHVMLARYDTLDYGTAIGNVVVHMSTFIAIATKFSEVLAQNGQSASLKTPAGSM